MAEAAIPPTAVGAPCLSEDSDEEPGPQASNPQSVDPITHMHAALEFANSGRQPTSTLSSKQLQLLTELAEDPEMVCARAAQAVAYWRQRKAAMASATDYYRTQLCSNARGTLGKLDLFLLEEMATTSDSVDTQYVQDLAAGFPITGNIDAGNHGTPIPGGQRINRKPGLGGAKPLDQLHDQCAEINARTIRKALAKTPRSAQEKELVVEAWAKVEKDIQNGHAAEPIELEAFDVREGLLVDTFGVWERHAGSNWKVRVISNFRANQANDYAWIPLKLRYDGFDELLEALAVLRGRSAQQLSLGKADFKSAFKTLPTAGDQQWL